MTGDYPNSGPKRGIMRVARALARQWRPIVAERVGERTGLRSPAEPMAPAGSLPDRDAWDSAQFGAFWFGQATSMLRVGGQTILTDPHFAEHAGVGLRGKPTGRRRSIALPATVDDLPPIDVLVLTHAHMDHWHKPTLERLVSPTTTVVVPKHTRKLLPDRGRGFKNVIELRWQETEDLNGFGVTAWPCKHWGARYLIDRFRGYNAYVIEDDQRKLLFAGDTADTDAFDSLADDTNPIDTAILGIGNSYEPWDRVHATPEQAAGMASRMGANRLMPIHHSTFHDAAEPVGQPLERLRAVWAPREMICEDVGQAHLE
ncbi:MAG: MBL fold metallo-hydrolase [Phycisphaera sp.]|nr:MAG: MBL fold metallo-hydrolase [Phycisphaera sp.]